MKAIYLYIAALGLSLTACHSDDDNGVISNYPIKASWQPSYELIDWDTAPDDFKQLVKTMCNTTYVIRTEGEYNRFTDEEVFDVPISPATSAIDFTTHTLVISYNPLHMIPQKTEYSFYYSNEQRAYIFNTNYTYNDTDVLPDNTMCLTRNAVLVSKLADKASVNSTYQFSVTGWDF